MSWRWCECGGEMLAGSPPSCHVCCWRCESELSPTSSDVWPHLALWVFCAHTAAYGARTARYDADTRTCARGTLLRVVRLSHSRWWEWQITAGSAVGHLESHGAAAVHSSSSAEWTSCLLFTSWSDAAEECFVDVCVSLQADGDLSHAVFLLHPVFCFLAPRQEQWWGQRFGEGPPCCTLSQPTEACWCVVMTYICGKLSFDFMLVARGGSVGCAVSRFSSGLKYLSTTIWWAAMKLLTVPSRLILLTLMPHQVQSRPPPWMKCKHFGVL